MKKLLAVGDSHSSTMYGSSWPDFLSESLHYELIRAASPGAGNSFYIEKLHEGLKHSNPDLVIIQLTEPSRIVTGLNGIGRNSDYNELESGTSFMEIECYTWNSHHNEEQIKKITGKNIKIDNVWLPQISTSRWVDYKIMQDITNMYFLCSHFNTKAIFFSWFIDFEKLFLDNYSWLSSQISWVKGHAWQELRRRRIPTISSKDLHFGSDAHKILVEDWLYPEILKNIF